MLPVAVCAVALAAVAAYALVAACGELEDYEDPARWVDEEQEVDRWG